MAFAPDDDENAHLFNLDNGSPVQAPSKTLISQLSLSGLSLGVSTTGLGVSAPQFSAELYQGTGQPCPALPFWRRRSADLYSRQHDRVAIGRYTVPGNRYGGLNQDFLVVQELFTPAEIPQGSQQTYVLAVCDGHGILGDKSACFAGKALARYLYCSSLRSRGMDNLTAEEIQAEMKAAFKRAHNAASLVCDMPPHSVKYLAHGSSTKLQEFTLVKVGDQKVYRNGKGSEKQPDGGTTCTAVVMQGRRICLANVGDSQAVLGHVTALGFKAEVVTVRHYGHLASEAERIQTEHSETTAVMPDGYIKAISGDWAGRQLAMTRALGHRHMEAYGVIAEPHCVMLVVQADTCCMILASDGLWDYMSPEAAVAHVMTSSRNGLSAAQAAQALVEAATPSCYGNHADQDNTTVIVVFFGSHVVDTLQPNSAPQLKPSNA